MKHSADSYVIMVICYLCNGIPPSCKSSWL